jgi:hypothetical protein
VGPDDRTGVTGRAGPGLAELVDIQGLVALFSQLKGRGTADNSGSNDNNVRLLHFILLYLAKF